MCPRVRVPNLIPVALARQVLALGGLMALLVLVGCIQAASGDPQPLPIPASTSAQGAHVDLKLETLPMGVPPGDDSGDIGFPETVSLAAAARAAEPEGPTSTNARPVDDRTYQWVGVVAASELIGLELQRDCDAWALLPQSSDVEHKLIEDTGHEVVIWGKVVREPNIYMRQAIAVEAAFGPRVPMPMTLVAIPEYPCPAKPIPPIPISQTITLLPGEMAARGTLIWDNWSAHLQTLSGRILLLLPADGLTLPPTTSAPAGTNNLWC